MNRYSLLEIVGIVGFILFSIVLYAQSGTLDLTVAGGLASAVILGMIYLQSERLGKREEERFLVERKEREAQKPRLEVRLEPVLPIPAWGFPKGHPEIAEGKQQSLTITVHNNSVTNLTAQFWLNNQGPNYLVWRMPTEETKPPQMVIHPGEGPEVIPGELTVRLYNQKVNVTKEDLALVMVWFAWRFKDGKEELRLNLEPPLSLDRSNVPPDAWVYVRIRFLSDQEIAEGEVQHFLLGIGEWGKLELKQIQVAPDPNKLPTYSTIKNPDSVSQSPNQKR